MQLSPLESPLLFPDFVCCYSAHLAGGDYRMHFAAGRACAARALAMLGHSAADVRRGAAGEPLWPAGVTGSITHKGDYISAAVALTSDVLSIGIDAEEIVDADRAARIARLVVLPREQSIGAGSVSAAVRFSLVFSIKEAVFKCLYPLVLKRFDYDALAVTSVNLEAGTFEAELMLGLSERFSPGWLVSGRVQLDERRVYTATWQDDQP